MSIEIANLIVNILIAIATFGALYQIKLSKDSFSTNSRRESVKYASELVDDYLRSIIPIQNNLSDSLKEIEFKKFKGEVKLKHFTLEEVLMEGGALKDHFMYTRGIIKPSIGSKRAPFQLYLDVANSVESFATPFIECVADEKVAFKAIGLTYCSTIRGSYYLYSLARSKGGENNYFPNTIALYDIWSKRIQEQELKTIAKRVEKTLTEISESKIELKSIGTN